MSLINRTNRWRGEDDAIEVGDLVQFRAFIVSKKGAAFPVKLPEFEQYYFVRECYASPSGVFIRLEEIVNPIIPGNNEELAFNAIMFEKVDSADNKINI